MIFLNNTRKQRKTTPCCKTNHCTAWSSMETGGTDENVDATSKFWQFNAGDNFAKTDG